MSINGSYRLLPLLILIAISLGACAASGGARKMAAGGSETMEPADPAQLLDSLAGISNGNYIHLYISPCFGKCEGHVSIYRQSPATFYLYDAQGWDYNEVARVQFLRSLRAPMNDDGAESIIRQARDAGIVDLVNDSTMSATDQAYIWVRASIDGKTVKVDNAYLGGKSYMGDGRLTPQPAGRGLYETYANLRALLFEPLRTVSVPVPKR